MENFFKLRKRKSNIDLGGEGDEPKEPKEKNKQEYWW